MEEKELRTLYKRGDKKAMEIIFHKYFDAVSYTIARMTDRSICEDVTQDAFEQIFKSYKNFKGHCSLATWVNRIAVNQSMKLRNKIKKITHDSIDFLKTSIFAKESIEDDLIENEEKSKS